MPPSEINYEVGESTAMRDGTPIVIRFVRASDEPMVVRFHEALSPDTVYSRYFNVFKLSERVRHERLERVCHPDDLHDIVLVAESTAETGERMILGFGRVSWENVGGRGEFALLIRDSHQKRGLGAMLLRRLIALAKARHLSKIRGDVLSGNLAMQRLCARLGMQLSNRIGDGVVRAELDLGELTPPRSPGT